MRADTISLASIGERHDVDRPTASALSRAWKAKTQGANEILIFCTTATSSFTSGVPVNASG